MTNELKTINGNLTIQGAGIPNPHDDSNAYYVCSIHGNIGHVQKKLLNSASVMEFTYSDHPDTMAFCLKCVRDFLSKHIEAVKIHRVTDEVIHED